MGSQLKPGLTKYLEELEASQSPVLRAMEREAEVRGFPIIGPQCGRRMAILTMAIQGRKVFEMGSGYGYSTVWFASAAGPSGEVVHTDFDPDNTARAKEYLEEAGLLDRVKFLNGDGLELLAAQGDHFDAILIDIDKTQYPLALQVSVPKLKVGGFLFCHNVVWSGRVAEDVHDPETFAIRQYNREIMTHPELVSFIDPVHDGLSVSLKVGIDSRARIPV
ncbi:MAG: O-methyltransferase [Fimbriimonadales bacterium]|nr:O-methyltransferase [Fimbriimonadales bacterium]